MNVIRATLESQISAIAEENAALQRRIVSARQRATRLRALALAADAEADAHADILREQGRELAELGEWLSCCGEVG